MIIRTKRSEDPFARIPHALLNDSRLSWRAKGILVYLVSKPEDWIVRSEDILNHGTEGRDAIRSSLKELRELGYASLVNTKDGREWLVRDRCEPCPEKPHLLKPCPEKPQMALANMAQSDTTKKEITVSKKEEREMELSLIGEPPKKKKGFAPPSVEEVTAYFKTLGMNGASQPEAQKFCDHHGQGGWILKNKMPMKDWQCAARLWRGNWERWAKPEITTPVKTQNPFDPNVEHPKYQEFVAGHYKRESHLKCWPTWRDAASDPTGGGVSRFKFWLKNGHYDMEGLNR